MKPFYWRNCQANTFPLQNVIPMNAKCYTQFLWSVCYRKLKLLKVLLLFWCLTIEKEILPYQTKSSKFRTLFDLFHRMQGVSGIKRITTSTLLLKETELVERQSKGFYCKWLNTNECLNVRLISLGIPTIGQYKDCLEFKPRNVTTMDREFYLSQFSKRTCMSWALNVPPVMSYVMLCDFKKIECDSLKLKIQHELRFVWYRET